MIWIGIIIGILVSELFCLCVFLATGENEDKGIAAGAGIMYFIVLCIATLLRFIHTKIRRAKYKALVMCPDGVVRYADSNWDNSEIGYKRECDGFRFAESELFVDYREEWDKDEFCKSMCLDYYHMNVRYAPKTVWSKFEKLDWNKDYNV